MADFKVNRTTPPFGNIKYGSQNVQKIYKGGTLVWPFNAEPPPPDCVDRVVVFQICNFNRIPDDNFNVYLNAFNWADRNNINQADLDSSKIIANIDQDCRNRCANLFVGSTDPSHVISGPEWVNGGSYTEGDVVSRTIGGTAEGSYICIADISGSTVFPENDGTHWELLFACPITLTAQTQFNPALLRGGSNTLFFENTQRNCCGNGFTYSVKNYLIDPNTGFLTDPLTIVENASAVATSPASYRVADSGGQNFIATFNFDSCGT